MGFDISWLSTPLGGATLSLAPLNFHESPEVLEKRAKRARINEIVVNVVLGAFITVAIVAVGGFLYSAYDEDIRLDKRAVVTTGIIEDEYTVSRTRYGPEKYRVRYVFRVDDHSYRGSNIIFERPYDTEAQVVYDPANPKNNRLVDGERNLDIRDYTAVILTFFAIVVMWFFRFVVKRASRKHNVHA